MQNGLRIACVFLAYLLMVFPDSYAETIEPAVYGEGGNIFLAADGKVTQLTNTGKDSDPVQSPDGRWIAFNREIEGKVKECEREVVWACSSYQLWIIDLESKSERMLLVPRPEDKDIEKVIYSFQGKTFSPDSQTIYFVTPAYAVSDAIHAVDIDGKNDRYITHGNTLQVVREPLSSDIKKYIVKTLKKDDWRIFPEKMGLLLIEKALNDDVTGYLIVDSNGVKIISSTTPLEGGWLDDDGKYYKSAGRRWWTKLISPDRSMGIPIGPEEW